MICVLHKTPTSSYDLRSLHLLWRDGCHEPLHLKWDEHSKIEMVVAIKLNIFRTKPSPNWAIITLLMKTTGKVTGFVHMINLSLDCAQHFKRALGAGCVTSARRLVETYFDKHNGHCSSLQRILANARSGRLQQRNKLKIGLHYTSAGITQNSTNVTSISDRPQALGLLGLQPVIRIGLSPR